MMRVLIINGHPSKESFCYALSQAYKQGALSAGAEVREINVGDLKFSPNLAHGYRRITELEEDLIKAQDSIKWAEHLVFVYPTWWGTMPALLKGFLPAGVRLQVPRQFPVVGPAADRTVRAHDRDHRRSGLVLSAGLRETGA